MEEFKVAQTLKIEVVKVMGSCPVYREGDCFYIEDGYRLRPGPGQALCMHGLSSLMPYYAALSRGIGPEELGLASAAGPGAYLQCPDPCAYTGGGTAIFRVLPGAASHVLEGVRSSSRAYPARPLVGVGGVVLKGEELLLVRRSAPPSQGLWSFPGGGVEIGEELAEALKREVREECGISIEVGRIVGVFDLIYRGPGGGVAYHYLLVDFLASYLEGDLRAGSDVADAVWVPCREALKFDLAEGPGNS